MADHTRVVRAITRLNIGGPARQALLLTKELSVTWPTVLVAGEPAPEEGELTDASVPVQRVPLVRPVRPRADAQALRELRALLKRHRPRIVHTHMAKAGLIGRVAATSVRPRPRTVHTFHGHVLEAYFKPTIERAFIEIERQVAKRTDVLIAISPQVRDSLLDLGIGRPDQYRVIPLGFDLSEHLAVEEPSGLLRQHLRLAHDTPLVGAVGRLVPVKDVPTLLRALKRLPDVHLALLGDGPDRRLLEAAASELGIAARVHFTGWWHDVPAAMSDLDVVVLSSLNEGTPVSLIEAAASSRPAVATDVGGVRYVVEDRATGLLCPTRDPEALAGAIQRVLADPAAAARFGARGRERVRSLFHMDRLVRDINDLYAELDAL